MELERKGSDGKNEETWLSLLKKSLSVRVRYFLNLYNNRKILEELKRNLKANLKDFDYDDHNVLSNGCVAVKKGIKWGVLDKKGEEIVPKEYVEIIEIGNGVFACRLPKKDSVKNRVLENLKKFEKLKDKTKWLKDYVGKFDYFFERTIYKGNKIIGDKISNIYVKDGNIYVKYKADGKKSAYQILDEDGSFKHPKEYFGIFGDNYGGNELGFKLDRYGGIVKDGEKGGKQYYLNEKGNELKNLGFVFKGGKIRFRISYCFDINYYATGEFKDGRMPVEGEDGKKYLIDENFKVIKEDK